MQISILFSGSSCDDGCVNAAAPPPPPPRVDASPNHVHDVGDDFGDMDIDLNSIPLDDEDGGVHVDSKQAPPSFHDPPLPHAAAPPPPQAADAPVHVHRDGADSEVPIIYLNHARDLQYLIAAGALSIATTQDQLTEDGTPESYEALYFRTQECGYSRDIAFQSVCGLDSFRRKQFCTLSKLAFFLSKRDSIDAQVAAEDARSHQPVQEPVRSRGRRPKKYKTMLTDNQRIAVYQALLCDSNGGILKKTSTRDVANCMGFSKRQVQDVWSRAKECVREGREIDVRQRKTKNCGRKRIVASLEQLVNVPLNKRQTLRALSHATHISRATLFRRLKQGFLRRHSSSLRPCLKDGNKRARLKFCIKMIDDSTIYHAPKFKDMHNVVHIDEKWFHMTKKNRRYYLHPLEKDPVRSVQNKNYIGKVMFLVAVARPRYDENGVQFFDGKIGVWAMVTEELAKRKSDNRKKGAIVTKNIKVNREVMRTYMCTHVIPAIHEKWPEGDSGPIFIQQDNAPSHVKADDGPLLHAINQTGRDIRIMLQPPNSPDLNILDLGFFRSLESYTDVLTPKTIEELITGVKNEFYKYDSEILNRIFVSLQSCMLEIMRLNGGNWYKIPHMNKLGLMLLDKLPDCLDCDYQLYHEVVAYLNAHVDP